MVQTGLAAVKALHQFIFKSQRLAQHALSPLFYWPCGHVVSGSNVIGMTMLLQFVVSFGFILPVNAPQNMIAYGTDTFDARDFVRTGLVITLAATVLLVIFALTYWPWMGYVTRAA